MSITDFYSVTEAQFKAHQALIDYLSQYTQSYSKFY